MLTEAIANQIVGTQAGFVVMVISKLAHHLNDAFDIGFPGVANDTRFELKR